MVPPRVPVAGPAAGAAAAGVLIGTGLRWAFPVIDDWMQTAFDSTLAHLAVVVASRIPNGQGI
jgi:hypothetical protein